MIITLFHIYRKITLGTRCNFNLILHGVYTGTVFYRYSKYQVFVYI